MNIQQIGARPHRIFAPALTGILFLTGCGGPVQATPSTASVAPASAREAPASPPSAAADTVRSTGLFDVVQVGGRLLFQIPDSILGRDILLISQIAGSPENFSAFLNSGSNVAEQVIRWERRNDRMLLRTITFSNVADPSLPIARSVEANTFAPILRNFGIERTGAAPGTSLVDVTALFETDVEAIAPVQGGQRSQFQIRRLDPSRTFIDSARSFPLNVEIRHTLTYEAGNPPSQSRTGTLSVQMAQSFVLLPAEPKQVRFHDPRVGWFTVRQVDFGSEAYKADDRRLIRRWRLEPSDPEAYARGELVEPVQPIVFYLDPGTPDEWAPYIRQGVEDWQPVFESAGFKNAILVRDVPTPDEDPYFSPEDVRYNMVRYIANMTRNATGPSVSDPRTGEIIASDIIWYHNHLRSYRNRLMIETGAANPVARSLQMDRDYIGESVRQVIAHEIGHAIGLPHNMIASSSFPVDSLRSPTFTETYGVAASIMDYARQNYVAQPGDGVERFIRGIGPYDHYSVEWGYRLYPEASSPEEEREFLNAFVLAHADDRRFRFGAGSFDPDNQTEDIGDDPVRASGYGIANLKRVLPNLPQWTQSGVPGADHSDLQELYGELVSSWNRYIGHVVTLIGGVHTTLLAADQAGTVHTPVPAARQREAMAFLERELLSTPSWLNEPAVLSRIEATGAVNRIRNLQTSRLNQILDPGRMLRMQEAELLGSGGYAPAMLLADVRAAVWRELETGAAVDPYRRNLQRAHIARLMELMDGDAGDAPALARAELSELLPRLEAAARRSGLDAMTQAHIQDQMARIHHQLGN